MGTFDFSHSLSPFGLLELASRFKQLQVGEALEITGMDAVSIADLQRILPEGQYELTHLQDSIEQQGGRRRMRLMRCVAQPSGDL